MRTIRLLSGALFLMGAMTAANAGAAELKVLSAEAMKPALQELAAAFEKESGNKLKIEYATDADGEKQVASDDSIDVAILTKDRIDKLIKSARILTFPKVLATGVEPGRCLCRGLVPSHRGTRGRQGADGFPRKPGGQKGLRSQGAENKLRWPNRPRIAPCCHRRERRDRARDRARSGARRVPRRHGRARRGAHRAGAADRRRARSGLGRASRPRSPISPASRRCAPWPTTVLGRHDRLDVLVNNAGIIAPRYQISQDGYELTIAVNHLAPFLLTNLLLDRLRASARASAPSRIVTVASQAHRGARLDLATWMDPDGWSPLQAYGRSKLCNILFTRALARRLAGQRRRRGLAASRRHRDQNRRFGRQRHRVRLAAGETVFRHRRRKARARRCFSRRRPTRRRFHGAYLIDSKPAQPDPAALDDALAERLWAESARLVGL